MTNRRVGVLALVMVISALLWHLTQSKVTVVILGEMKKEKGHLLRTAKGKSSQFNLAAISQLSGVLFAGAVDTVMATRHPEPPGAEHWVMALPDAPSL